MKISSKDEVADILGGLPGVIGESHVLVDKLTRAALGTPDIHDNPKNQVILLEAMMAGMVGAFSKFLRSSGMSSPDILDTIITLLGRNAVETHKNRKTVEEHLDMGR